MRNSMHQLAVIILVLLACSVAWAQTPSETPKNEIEIRVTVSVPTGQAQFQGTTGGGSIIDFRNDFDFKTEVGYNLRYTYRAPSLKHKFLVEYLHTDWSRDSTLSRSFTFLGQTYVANLSTHGDLGLGTLRAMYAYRWGTDKLRIGPMVDMGFVRTSLELTGTTNNGTRTAKGSITKFFATIGYDLDYNATPNVNIFSNLGAIAFQGERFLHTDSGVRFYPSKHFGVTGGYRYSRDKVKKDDNFTLIRAHGPFFGGLYRF